MSKTTTTRKVDGTAFVKALEDAASLDMREAALRITKAEGSLEGLAAALKSAKKDANADWAKVARWVAANCRPTGAWPTTGKPLPWQSALIADLAAVQVTKADGTVGEYGVEAARKSVQRYVRAGLVLLRHPSANVGKVRTLSEDAAAAKAAFLSDADPVEVMEAEQKRAAQVKGTESEKGAKVPATPEAAPKGGKVTVARIDYPASIRAILKAWEESLTPETAKVAANAMAGIGAEMNEAARRAQAKAATKATATA